jgi:hypothetical protein
MIVLHKCQNNYFGMIFFQKNGGVGGCPQGLLENPGSPILSISESHLLFGTLRHWLAVVRPQAHTCCSISSTRTGAGGEDPIP